MMSPGVKTAAVGPDKPAGALAADVFSLLRHYFTEKGGKHE